MRYFFVSYYHSNPITKTQGYGQCSFEHEVYPSNSVINNYIEDKESHKVVLNIIELNEIDYNSFRTYVEPEDGLQIWTNHLFEYMMDKFSFSSEMISNSINVAETIKGIKLSDLYDQNKTLADAVEAIWGIKIEE